MASDFNEERAPGVSYKDLLDRLGELKSDIERIRQGDLPIETIIFDWVTNLDPTQINTEFTKVFREVAIVLEEWAKRNPPPDGKFVNVPSRVIQTS